MIWRRSPLLTVKSTDKSALSSRITRHCIRFLFGKIRWDLIWLAALFDWGPLVASVLALRPFRRLRNRSILSYSFHLQAKWQNFRRFFLLSSVDTLPFVSVSKYYYVISISQFVQHNAFEKPIFFPPFAFFFSKSDTHKKFLFFFVGAFQFTINWPQNTRYIEQPKSYTSLWSAHKQSSFH